MKAFKVASSIFTTILFMVSCASDDALTPTPVNNIKPPFQGTIFLDPDIITSDDATTFSGLTYQGTGARTMFDRRVNSWVTVDAFLFNAEYSDKLYIEIQVNIEFGSSETAEIYARKYAEVIGRLPVVLRWDVQTVSIHQGTELFGGGNNNLLIHVGQGELYLEDGILEETLVHEASHTSLDRDHATSAGWLEAQKNDPTFISTYAKNNPFREDIAESFLVYLALKYRPDRISESLKHSVQSTIPNRISYFENQGFDMYPIE